MSLATGRPTAAPAGISDPGSYLVSKVREQFGASVSVVPIPGPSAVIAALSISGFRADHFLFLGFLPHKKGRETLFKEIAMSKRTVVFYESPHRILKTLKVLVENLHDRRIALARELTKIHEEVKIGTGAEILEYFTTHPERVRGEFVVLIESL